MARDDWRIRIELPEEDHAHGLLGRLRSPSDETARRLEEELEGRRLAVTRDDSTIFVYVASSLEAESAQRAVLAELAETRHPGDHRQARALARRRGSLGRRASRGDLGAGRDRPRLRALGGPDRQGHARRSGGAHEAARGRGAPGRAELLVRDRRSLVGGRSEGSWPAGSAARSRAAARSSGRRRPETRSRSSAASAATRPRFRGSGLALHPVSPLFLRAARSLGD